MSDQIRTELPVVEKSACGCGEHEADIPSLDARQIPHAIRHATIFGALNGLRPGQQMDLIAPHDPLPLLGQIEQMHGEAVTWTYVERGPEAWTLRLTRNA